MLPCRRCDRNSDTENDTQLIYGDVLRRAIALCYITPRDYLSDPEFADLYRYMSEGEPPVDDRAFRAVLVRMDSYYIDENDGVLFNHVRGMRVCVPIKYQSLAVDIAHLVYGHPSAEVLHMILKVMYSFRNLHYLCRFIAFTCPLCLSLGCI